jgi:hypothetical protein
MWEAGPVWDSYVKLEESQYANNISGSVREGEPTACGKAAIVARRAAAVPCDFSLSFHKKYIEVKMPTHRR